MPVVETVGARDTRERVAAAVRKLGPKEVARRVGLKSAQAVLRYAVGAPVQSATAIVIENGLPSIEEGR
jgi:hypothetical protein